MTAMTLRKQPDDDLRVILYCLLGAIAIALVSTFLFTGCSHRTAADLPASQRQGNWSDADADAHGSCGWASLASLVLANGDQASADEIVGKCGGPAVISFTVSGPGMKAQITDSVLIDELDRLGIEHIETADGDESFLIEACTRGPGCVAGAEGGRHAIAVVAIDETTVTYLGPNHRRFYRVPKSVFLAEWRNAGGWAICPLPCW